jgi:hypothetical protein
MHQTLISLGAEISHNERGCRADNAKNNPNVVYVTKFTLPEWHGLPILTLT